MEKQIMAGMFYSLEEAAEKLGKTPDDVKQLAKEGKLREFRDGSALLFKIEEVDALQSDEVDLALDLSGEGTAQPESQEQPAGSAGGADDMLDDLFDLDETPDEGRPEKAEEFDLEAAAESEGPSLEGAAEAAGTSELDLGAESDQPKDEGGTKDESGTEDEDFLVLDESEEGKDETAEPQAEEQPEKEPQPEPAGETTGDEISLAPDSILGAGESDITDMDTALTGEGVSVLSESDADYDVTDDSMAETAGPAGTSTEASLKEIEDDVNLDSFGSGSGLLDLSLQADDTSLGGILDEIYTAEGGEEEAAAAEPGSVEDISAEADQAVPEELGAPEAATPVAAPVAPVGVGAAAYAEVPPDTQSNMLGMLLFLPLAALLYTTIVAVSGQRGVMPSILGSIQGLIWYIMGGAVLVTAAVVGASFVVAGERTAAPRAPKKAKTKKERAPKAKKEKTPKAKKEKKPKAKKEKAPKAKKEKKPLFGKKKKG
jgi:excisionase family DNA binding protein